MASPPGRLPRNRCPADSARRVVKGGAALVVVDIGGSVVDEVFAALVVVGEGDVVVVEGGRVDGVDPPRAA